MSVLLAALSLAGCQQARAERTPVRKARAAATSTQAARVPKPAAPTPATKSPARAREKKPAADPLREVFWVTTMDGTLASIASTFGMRESTLRELNPEIAAPAHKRRGKPDPGPVLPAGTRLRVFKKDPERPTRSIGTPNRGRLVSGIPLPEGDGWRLRDNRRRTYGTHKAISTLLEVFGAYREAYPGGPEIRVGEIARRRGGRARPHRSHRTGRDIDIGYIHQGGPDDPERRFQRTTAKNFDREKNWFLVQTLLETGEVQSIYMSSRVQRWLRPEAAKHLSEEQLNAYFQHPYHDESHHALIRHSPGHRNHLHVRFRCEDWNRRCRARSRYRGKKRGEKAKGNS